MCGCFVLLLGAIFPRFALVLVELFSNWNERAFDSFVTTLAYSAMNAWGDPINGFGWVIVVFAFFADLGSWFGAGARGQR